MSILCLSHLEFDQLAIMKTISFVFLMLIPVLSALGNVEIAPVRKGDKWDVYDVRGMVVGTGYDRVQLFSPSDAVVKKGNEWFFLKDRAHAVRTSADFVKYLGYGLFHFQYIDGSKRGRVYNSLSREYSEIKIRESRVFAEGVAAVLIEDQGWVLVDQALNVVWKSEEVQPCGVFRYGVMPYSKEGSKGYGYMNRKFDLITDKRFDYANNYEGKMLLNRETGSELDGYRLYKSPVNRLDTLDIVRFKNFSCGFGVVFLRDGSWRIVDRDGRDQEGALYDVSNVHSGKIVIKRSPKDEWVELWPDGVKIPINVQKVISYYGSFIWGRTSRGNYGLFNLEGKLITDGVEVSDQNDSAFSLEHGHIERYFSESSWYDCDVK